MSINLKLETYESASDILNATKNILNDVMLTIDEVQNNLDYRINSYVKRDLTYTKNSIDNTNYSTTKLVNRIIEKKENYRDLENKIATRVSEITNVSNTTNISNLPTTEEVLAATGAVIDNATSKIYIDETGAKTATKTKSVVSKICDFGQKIFQTVKSGLITIVTDPINVLKRVGASIANAAIAFTQGLGEFIEGLVDTGAIIATGVKSIFTGLYDGYQWLKGKITGDENWTSKTKQMWTETQDFIKTTYVKSAYKSFFENTNAGKWLNENAYNPLKYGGVGYQVLDGIGYFTGMLLLSAATGGAGKVVGERYIGHTAILKNTNTLKFGIIGATAGFGKNTETAWNDGASLGEGLAYGAVKGAWEGLENAMIYQVNSLNVFGKDWLINRGATITTRAALDGSFGATTELITPIFQTIYSPNEQNIEEVMKYVNYDKNGNKINDKKWEDLTFNEKYRALFEYNGGWKNVGTSALSTASLSLVKKVPKLISERNTYVVAKSAFNNDGSRVIVVKRGKRKYVLTAKKGK